MAKIDTTAKSLQWDRVLAHLSLALQEVIPAFSIGGAGIDSPPRRLCAVLSFARCFTLRPVLCSFAEQPGTRRFARHGLDQRRRGRPRGWRCWTVPEAACPLTQTTQRRRCCSAASRSMNRSRAWPVRDDQPEGDRPGHRGFQQPRLSQIPR